MDQASNHQAAIPPAEDGQDLWPRRHQSFVRLYRGRDDVIARLCDGQYKAVEGEGLTLDRFRDHVQLKDTYAIYNRDDAGMVRFGLFDLDIFPRDQGWPNLLRALPGKKEESLRLVRTLLETGLSSANILAEFPTVGYHILIFFPSPVPAADLKAAMAAVLRRCGLPEVPYYPRKVDELWGDRVQLPLRVNLNTGRRSNFVADLSAFDPLHYPSEPNFSLLDRVVPVDPAWVRETL